MNLRARPTSRRRASYIAQMPWKQLVNLFPPVRLISDDQVEAIHLSALQILETTGIRCAVPEVLDVMERTGACVDRSTGNIRTGRDIVEAHLGLAPTEIVLTPRNPARACRAGGNNVSTAARLGSHVIVLDETANWKGGGTALTLAEAGHKVTIVTGAVAVMSEMARTNADMQLRSRLRQLGVAMFTEAVMLEWHGDGATIQTSGGAPMRIDGDSLVVAATNVAEHALADELGAPTIGDATAARNAAMAIYEGRKMAMAI